MTNDSRIYYLPVPNTLEYPALLHHLSFEFSYNNNKVFQ